MAVAVPCGPVSPLVAVAVTTNSYSVPLVKPVMVVWVAGGFVAVPVVAVAPVQSGRANWSPLDAVRINHVAAVTWSGPGEVHPAKAWCRRHHRRADGAERCARDGVAPGSFPLGA